MMMTRAVKVDELADTAGSSSGKSSIENEVPIFLQKAYHMIDTCDPTICSWSDDGYTFIVKNTHLFETSIIPQFFKHNKFSSFVRQLNFYGFRKIKFSDSLRIDYKLEAETAKFWRFKHDKFRRGRMDLLAEIKRTPSASSSATALPSVMIAASTLSSSSSSSLTAATKAMVPTQHVRNVPVSSLVLSHAQQQQQQQQQQKLSHSKSPPEEVSHLRLEMQELKQRMAFMTKSIDELTDLVNKASIKDTNNEKNGMMNRDGFVSPGAATVEPETSMTNNKRKKMDVSGIGKHKIVIGDDEGEEEAEEKEMGDLPMIDATEMNSLFYYSEDALPDLITSNTESITYNSDDTYCVDELFQAFVDEESNLLPELDMDYLSSADHNISRCSHVRNAPDPMLMKRIEDALSTLPREMHDMIATRLIDAIFKSHPIVQSASLLFPSYHESTLAGSCHFVDESSSGGNDNVVSEHQPSKTISSIHSINNMTDTATTADVSSSSSSIPLPLAVATLKTILAEYGVSVECTHLRASCKDVAASLEKRTTMFANSLPVVSMNA